MKGHCDRHLGDELHLDWLREVGYGVCEVCNRILSTKFRGRCPSCWPAFVSSRPRPISGRPLPDDMPPLDLVLTTRVHLRTSVPRSAKNAWSTCLNTALAGIIAHRDTRAWTDFLILPSLVLPSPSSGGSSRTRRSTNETRRRCQDWLNGVGLELWDPPWKSSSRTPASERKSPPEASFNLDEHTSTRFKLSSLRELYAGLARHSRLILRSLPPRRTLMNSVFCTEVPRMPTDRNSSSCVPLALVPPQTLNQIWSAGPWLHSRPLLERA